MEALFEVLKGFNVPTLIGIWLIVWYFANKLEVKMERHEKRTDRLYEMFIDLLKERNHGKNSTLP